MALVGGVRTSVSSFSVSSSTFTQVLEDTQMDQTGFCRISPPSPQQLLLNVICSAYRVYCKKELLCAVLSM